MSPETLRNWIRVARKERGESGKPWPRRSKARETVSGSQLEAENLELRRQVRELQEERDILRRAAKYFAGETRW